MLTDVCKELSCRSYAVCYSSFWCDFSEDGWDLLCLLLPLWPCGFAVKVFSNNSMWWEKYMIWQVCALWKVIWHQSSLTQIFPSHAGPDPITSGCLSGNPSLCGGFADNNAQNNLWAMGTDRRWIVCHSRGCPDQGNNQAQLSVIIIFSPWLSLFLGLVSNSASALKGYWKLSRENMK